jgi:hypothetical protein
MASPLQLALVARELSDVMVFHKPPTVQCSICGVLAPSARPRGCRTI